MINAKTSDLIGVDWRVVQFGAMMESLVHDQNVCLVGSRVIPGCSSRHNWHIRERFNGFVTGMNIDVSGCKCKNNKVVAKATCVCIRIRFIC